MITLEAVVKRLQNEKTRSKWDKAIIEDAIDLAQYHTENGNELDTLTMEGLLNGAKNWHEYSWGGSALAYDADIAEHYCTPSELKKTHNGTRRPNAREEWLDVQARALGQAARKLLKAVEYLQRMEVA